MANAVWPGAPLAQALETDNSSNAFPDGAVRTTAGKHITRMQAKNVSYDDVEPLNGQIVCSIADKSTVETFYKTSCANGALPFDGMLDNVGILKTFLFLDPPKFTPMGDHWMCVLTFEIMPG